MNRNVYYGSCPFVFDGFLLRYFPIIATVAVALLPVNGISGNHPQTTLRLPVLYSRCFTRAQLHGYQLVSSSGFVAGKEEMFFSAANYPL